MKWVLNILFLSLLAQSCATFKADFQNEVKLSTANLNSISGRYEISPVEIDTTSRKYNPYKLGDNFLVEMDRKPFALPKNLYDEDSINYFVELEIKNPNTLEVRFLQDESVFDTRTLKVKLKGNGYLYLKNSNIKFWGIPYLFGAMDINRQRISIDIVGNLILDVANYRGGAIFLIGMIDGGRTLYRKRLEKVE